MNDDDKPPTLKYLQHNHMMRLKLMRQMNIIKAKADKEEEISDNLQKNIDQLHTNMEEFTETHEKGLQKLEDKLQ